MVNSSITPLGRLSKYKMPDSLPNMLYSAKHTNCFPLYFYLLLSSDKYVYPILVGCTICSIQFGLLHFMILPLCNYKNSVITSTKVKPEKKYFHNKGFSLLQASLKYFIYITCIQIICNCVRISNQS